MARSARAALAQRQPAPRKSKPQAIANGGPEPMGLYAAIAAEGEMRAEAREVRRNALTPEEYQACVMVGFGQPLDAVIAATGLSAEAIALVLSSRKGTNAQAVINEAASRFLASAQGACIRFLVTVMDDVEEKTSDRLDACKQLGERFAKDLAAIQGKAAHRLAQKRVNAAIEEIHARRQEREQANAKDREAGTGVTIVPADSDAWLAEAMRPTSGPEAFL